MWATSPPKSHPSLPIILISNWCARTWFCRSHGLKSLAWVHGGLDRRDLGARCAGIHCYERGGFRPRPRWNGCDDLSTDHHSCCLEMCGLDLYASMRRCSGELAGRSCTCWSVQCSLSQDWLRWNPSLPCHEKDGLCCCACVSRRLAHFLHPRHQVPHRVCLSYFVQRMASFRSSRCLMCIRS